MFTKNASVAVIDGFSIRIAMGDFSASVTGFYCLCVLCTIVLRTMVLATGLGKCPVYPQLPNFNPQKMQGKWYEVERSFYLVEITSRCTELDVMLNDRGQFVITVNTINRWTGNLHTHYGLGIPSHNGSSVFRYKQNNRMPYVLGRMLPGAGEYTILYTDYRQFALIWSCVNLSVAHADRMWVLGRQRDIDAELRAQIYSVMVELQLDPDRLLISKNSNCTDISNFTITSI